MVPAFVISWVVALRRFRTDTRGNILFIFAFSSLAIFAGLAAGIDLARAYAARQRLSQVATLACQYSTRPSVARTANASYSGTNGFQTYVDAVNAFARSSLGTQHWNGAVPTGATATPNSYFTATPAVGGTTASAVEPTNPVVEMNAVIPATFGRIVNLSSINVHARIACQTLDTTPQVVTPPALVKEGFETPCAGYCYKNPSGGNTYITTATNGFPASAGYTGYNGFQWYIVGYCLETDAVGVISSTVPEGTHSAELDCENGSGSAGNSSISTKQYLEVGQYELRYNYRSRVAYPDYSPAYICGSTASDVSWANNTNVPWWPSPLRTNQINVYLDTNIVGTGAGSAPLHQTIDGTQQLAGQNLIDTCVYSPTWIERSVKIKVTRAGDYWLSFAADGTSDSYGGQIDNIRLCQRLCDGSLQDNFPTSWLAAYNGGANKLLFEDSFEAPTYSQDSPPHYVAKAGNLGNSLGSNVVGSGCDYSYAAVPGWPCLKPTGWAVAPYNQVTYSINGAYDGNQYISLDGYNGFSTGSATRNRLISKQFLLDPGYYRLEYNYISMVDFTPSNVLGTYCYAAPTSGSYYYSSGAMLSGKIRYYNTKSADVTTNIVSAFMSHSQLVSTPISSTTMGATTSYTNPDGTTSTTPTVAPDAVSWQSYDASAVNPVLDTCGYADGYRWIPRAVSVKIKKPGYYWLTFSANGGAADGDGGAIDDVRLTALGSPFMSNPPISPLVTIPVPAPQADTSYAPSSNAGFTIVADPFMPPGADQ